MQIIKDNSILECIQGRATKYILNDYTLTGTIKSPYLDVNQ